MEEFSMEVTKRAVAKACIALDFKYTSSSVLDVMADIVHNYIQSIGVHTREQADVAGRSQPGIHDALAALEQTRPTSTSWKHLRDFAFKDVKNPSMLSDDRWCEPFPYVIPAFPVRQKTNSIQSSKLISTSEKENLKESYIPSHLPPFPPEHTYKRTTKKRNLATDNQSNSSDTQQLLLHQSSQPRAKRIAATKSVQKSLSQLEEIRSLDTLPGTVHITNSTTNSVTDSVTNSTTNSTTDSAPDSIPKSRPQHTQAENSRNLSTKRTLLQRDEELGITVPPSTLSTPSTQSVLEVEQRVADPLKAIIDLTPDARKELIKEQKILMGVSTETSSSLV